MSKIDTTQWKDYAIADLFEIKKGTRLTRANMKDGDIRYIGASTFNNGITAQISNDEHLHPANSISVSYNGSVGEAFYQDEPFWASDDVNVLYPKFQLTRNIALFIIPIIKQIGKQYAFIDKWKKEDMERDMLKLPAKSDGTPDFDYMEEYIDKQIARSSTFIAQFRHRVPSSKGKITTSNWKSFRIEQLFDVVKGSRLTKAEMKDGTIRYVGASSFNNGITAYISNTEQLHPANTLKVAIITGASYGMGQSMAELFAEEGAAVVLTARHQEKLDAVVDGIREKGGKAIGVVADVCSTDDTKRVFETALKEFGDVDILINNAGIGEQKMIDETDDDWMMYVMNTNLGGPMRYIREALKIFLPKNDGVIINVSSVNGIRPFCGATYTSTKGALNTLTKNVAMRLIDTNIRCNAVAPGATVTPAHLANKAGEQPGGAEMLKYSGHFVYFPGPECDPMDQAYACLYLASKMGRHVKGQVLQVCNGAFL